MKTFVLTAIFCLMIGTCALSQESDEERVQTVIKRLEERLALLTPAFDSSWCRRIKADIAELQKAVSRLAASSGTGTVADAHWRQLATEVEALRAEHEKLRVLINGQETLLASLGDEAAAVALSHDRLGDPSDAITVQPTPPSSTLVTDEPASSKLMLSGFVDGSSYVDHANGANTFGLDQIELDLQKSLSEQWIVRADVEGLNDGAGGIDVGIEQGFLAWQTGRTWNLQITFGKFNAPIGFEALDPVDMFQYSRGLIGTYCTPSNLTGILSKLAAPRLLDWSIYIVNGWDVNADNNKSKTLGTRFALRPLTNLSLGLSAVTGAEQPGNDGSQRSVLDCDVTCNPAAWWLVGGEAILGWETEVLDDAATAQWHGFQLMSQVKFLDRYALTIRGDLLNDAHGNRTGTVQKLNAVCLSPSLAITEGFSALFEARYNWSDHDVFAAANGSSKTSQFVTALELTYAF